MSGHYHTDDDAFAALVDKHGREYERLTDAKLVAKIRHLTRAVGRCSLPRNQELMLAFRARAMAIAKNRLPTCRICGGPLEDSGFRGISRVRCANPSCSEHRVNSRPLPPFPAQEGTE